MEDFSEANCRFLLINRNWKGLVMDGSPDHIAALQKENISWRQDLKSKAAFITAENIERLIEDEGFSGPIGILSIDLDGNDYWLWKAIKNVDPAIVICEYNTLLGDMEAIVVPYDPGFMRFEKHFSGSYYGASISALIRLAKMQGYTFLGSNQNGINAFFVRDDLARWVVPLLSEQVAFPSRHRGGLTKSGNLAFTVAAERVHQVYDFPVVDVAMGKIVKIGDIKKLYSDRWMRGMT